MSSSDSDDKDDNVNTEIIENLQKCIDAIQETSKKVESAVVPSIESHTGTAKNSDDPDFIPSKDGLDFLDVKNTLMLSYLIDLTIFVKTKISGNTTDTQNLNRLIEMKAIMDKLTGMDKKLRYQIDKLLTASTSATTYASGGDNNHNNNTGPEDPLQFRPDPTALLDDDEEDESDGDDSVNGDDDDDDDDDLAAAKKTLSLSKARNRKKSYTREGKKNDQYDDDDDDGDDNGGGGIYRAPRQTAVPYGLDQSHKLKEKEKRARRRMHATELAQTLKEQYGDAPEMEDMHGGSDMGKQRAAARRLAEREAEKIRFEEDNMVRLTVSRKDKKEKKRVMQSETSNLAAIADLGNLVRETREFGRSSHRDDDNDSDQGDGMMAPRSFGGGSRYDNGKRKREFQDVNTGKSYGRQNRYNNKVGKAKNAVQAALYSSGGVKGQKRNKKR